MLEIVDYLKARYLSEKAQGMVEYALIIAFVVAVAVVALKASTSEGLGKAIKDAFDLVSNKISNWNS